MEKKRIDLDETDKITENISPTLLIENNEIYIKVAKDYYDLIEKCVKEETELYVITHCDHDDYIELEATENDNEYIFKLYKEGRVIHAFSDYIYKDDFEEDLKYFMRHFKLDEAI